MTRLSKFGERDRSVSGGYQQLARLLVITLVQREDDYIANETDYLQYAANSCMKKNETQYLTIKKLPSHQRGRARSNLAL
jgi:hypothetical protein